MENKSSVVANIFKSRKFVTGLADVIFSTALYFVVKYINPSAADDIIFLIASFQPVIALVIAGWAYEDGQEKAAARLAG